MIKKIGHFLNEVFKRKKEHYLLIEERDGGFDVTQAVLDAEHKRIIVLAKDRVGNLGAVRRPWKFSTKVIFALGDRKAATIESEITVRRADPAVRIAEEELDQLVFKGLWEFLNRYRSWASKKLRVPDVDLVLSDIQVRDVALDHRRLFNPVGFEGRQVNFGLRGTFTTRSIMPLLERFRSWGDVIVLESGSVLGRAVPGDDYWFVLTSGESTIVYRHRPEESIFAGEIDWNAASLTEGLKRDLFLDEESLAELVRRYEIGEISEHMARRVETALSDGLKALGTSTRGFVSANKGGGRPTLHFHVRSVFTPKLDWSKRLGGEAVRLDERLERENFSVDAKKRAAGFSPVRDQTTLALLFYSYEAPKYGLLNGILQRRARWLISNL